MTIDTIKNVLTRIMTINQNLTEESLHTLLVASGWDEHDIKEGVSIFKSVRGGQDINDYEPIINEEEIKRVAKNESTIDKKNSADDAEQAKDKLAKEEDSKQVKSTAADFIFPYHGSENKDHNVLKSLREKIFEESEGNSKSLSESNTKTEFIDSGDKVVGNILDTSIPFFSEDKDSDDKDNDNVDVTASKVDTSKVADSSTSKHKAQFNLNDYRDRPIGLIILDCILFIVVLSLIAYILIN